MILLAGAERGCAVAAEPSHRAQFGAVPNPHVGGFEGPPLTACASLFFPMHSAKPCALSSRTAVVACAVQWYKDKSAIRFITMTFLTGSLFFVELIVGLAINSLALQV